MEHGNLRDILISDYEYYLNLYHEDPMLEHHLRTSRIVHEVIDKLPTLDGLLIIRLYAEILDVCSNGEDWALEYALNFVQMYF